jgi:hypothetical protein
MVVTGGSHERGQAVLDSGGVRNERNKKPASHPFNQPPSKLATDADCAQREVKLSPNRRPELNSVTISKRREWTF